MKEFTPKNYQWSHEGLEQCIAENKMKSKIILYSLSAAIVKVDNYEESQSLGAVTDWCICQHSCSWRDYVGKYKNRMQLFFYDFTMKHDQNLSMVGATFEVQPHKGPNLICSFSRENKPLKEKLKTWELPDRPYTDYDALCFLIMYKHFGDTSIYYIVEKEHNSAKNSEKPETKKREITTSFDDFPIMKEDALNEAEEFRNWSRGIIERRETRKNHWKRMGLSTDAKDNRSEEEREFDAYNDSFKSVCSSPSYVEWYDDDLNWE